MKYYPAYLDLRGRSCLVVGGGAVAERKIHSLLDARATVVVVSPSLTPALKRFADSSRITHREKEFDESDLTGSFLAIAATDSPEVNRLIAAACDRSNMLVNVAVPPEAGNFIVPSAISRGDLLIAVSTSGASPAMSRKIRQELEGRYGPEYGMLLERLAAVRAKVLATVANEQERTDIFHAIVNSDAVDLLSQGRVREAESLISAIADRKNPS